MRKLIESPTAPRRTPLGFVGSLLGIPKESQGAAPAVVAVGGEVETSLGVATPMILKDLSYAMYQQIHRADLCLGCINLNDPDGHWDRLGVYYFDAGDHYQNGPYVREAEPREVIKVDSLPEDLRQAIAQCRFDGLKFPEVKYLQPLEHMPCSTWGGDTYLASDMKTEVPMPPDEEVN